MLSGRNAPIHDIKPFLRHKSKPKGWCSAFTGDSMYERRRSYSSRSPELSLFEQLAGMPCASGVFFNR